MVKVLAWPNALPRPRVPCLFQRRVRLLCSSAGCCSDMQSDTTWHARREGTPLLDRRWNTQHVIITWSARAILKSPYCVRQFEVRIASWKFAEIVDGASPKESDLSMTLRARKSASDAWKPRSCAAALVISNLPCPISHPSSSRIESCIL